MKHYLLAVLLALPAAGLVAQTMSGGSLFTSPTDSAAPSPTPEKSKDKDKPGGDQAQGPTVIDSSQMDYDEKTRLAIFTGENYGVIVKDPSLTVYCDKLTAKMRKAPDANAAVPGAPGGPSDKKPAKPDSSPKGSAKPKSGSKPKGSVTPKPSPTAKPSASAPAKPGASPAADSRGSGLESAIAEGTANYPVVIVQDKPATSTEAAQHDVGIAMKADYNADSGDIVLTGWPRVSQGADLQIATSDHTIMIMNKDKKTMRTIGPARTVIIEQQDQVKKSGTNAATPDSSPSTSPQ